MPQLELLPNANPPKGAKLWIPSGAAPPDLFQFGKFFDTSNWRLGDLVLTREIAPDCVGGGIFRTQSKGGYRRRDARWTHAAMYIGDDEVCEATFSYKNGRHGVTITPLWEYCGDSAVRVRRPLRVGNNRAHLLVIKAMRNLRKPYAFGELFRLGFLALRGKGFWSATAGGIMYPPALVCSTLYADAYAGVTNRTLGEKHNGICTPAFLSLSSEFQDIPLQWLRIEQ